MSKEKYNHSCCHNHKHKHRDNECGCQHHDHDESHSECHHKHEHKCECHCHHHEDECNSGCHHHEHHHEDHEQCGCCHEGCGCNHNHGENHFLVLLIRSVISIILIIISTFFNGYIQNSILVISYLIISYDVLFSAVKNVVKGRAFDENFLMSIASITALVVPFFTSKANIDPYDGIMVIILYQVGEYIQHKAVDKSKKSISEMLELDVETVTVVRNDEYVEIGVEEIKLDDVIVVKPGDLLVVDGIVVKGTSSINTSALTGESMPKEIFANDEVLSGCINNDGLLLVKATTTIKNSTTAKVKDVVEKANKNKATLDRFFTKFAKVYTPVVIVISLFIMFVLPLILGFEKHFLTYLYKGLAIMVISCPCALVISIPLSYFMGIGKAAKNQILVKGASYLEILSDIDSILFDKTGTLTKGEFIVTKVESIDLKLMNDLLYSIEKNFTHAIARSITNYLKNDVVELEITDLVNLPGYGVKAMYQGKNVLVGNAKLLEENNVEFSKVDSTTTVIYVSYDGEFLGYLILEDELKNDAVETLNKLINNYDVHIISGDKHESVKNLSQRLNVSNYYAELLPQEKVEIVKKIKKGKNIIYVGDGINDAACLLEATVGMGMRSLGSDIAINASDIVLMDDSIESVEKAIRISKKTKRIVIQNIVFSLGVKVLVMLLAILLEVPMYLAIIADVGVAMIAVLNSLRIMYGEI